MKLQKLIISAFGPYANTQVLDFESNLKDQTMFVISGNTGAGKTTIFDAINFALYGNASGSERDGKSLRSDFASSDTDTEIELWFSLKNKYYYIKRCPQYERAKLRGEGTTKKSAYAELKSIDDNKLITGYNEVTLAIEKILGINSSQFKQLVMIPQGEFKKLLNADSREKELIFRKIFATESFDQIQRQIVEKANNLSLQISDSLKNKQNSINRFIHEDNDLKELITSPNPNYSIILTQFDSIINNDINDMKDFSKTNSNIKKTIESLTEKIIKGEEHNRKIDYLDRRIKALEELNQKIINTDILFHESELELENNKKSYGEKSQLEKQIDRLNHLKDKLSILNEKESNLTQIKSMIQSQESTILKNKKLYETTNNDIQIISQKLEDIQKLDIENLKLEQNLNEQRDMYSKINSVLKNIYLFDEISNNHKNKSIEFENFEKKYKSAKLNFENIEDNFRKNQAGILADSLIIGSPCPVCGSLDHPSPAKSNEALVSELDVKEAKLNFEKISNYRESLLTELTSIKQDLTSLVSNVITPSVSELFVDENTKLEFNVTNSSTIIQKLESIKMSISEKGVTTKAIYTQNKEIISQKETLLKNKKSLENNLLMLSDKEKLYQLELDDYKLKAASLNENINTIKLEFEGTIKAYDEITKEINEAKSKLELLEKNLTFAENNYKTLKAQLDKLIGQKINSENEIENLKIEMSNEITFSNLDEIKLNLESNKNELSIIESKIKLLDYRILNNQNIVSELKSLDKKTSELEGHYKTIGFLANVIKGENSSKISFERYVLSAYYEDIIDAANLRFSKMTMGRFELSRKQDVSDARKKSGLDLEIFDNYTGKFRDIKTLSGGESFKASLSMALGLADVVQSYSGGIQLDTMFIDEGFGTLDPESLEKAIECLIELQQDGRIVGIISHVPELKERIDTKLEVALSNNGSCAKFIN